MRATTVTRQKQFQKGLEQLEEEGVMQVLTIHEGLKSEPILAVVGELQFDVLRSRLETEYDVETTIRKIYAVQDLENFLGDRLREGR